MSGLSKHLEHTLLKPDASLPEIKLRVEEAMQYQFAGVCLPPFYVRDARRLLGEENPVSLVTVVGFPMGYTAIAAKVEEIKRAIDDGADEIDAVLNIAAVRSANWSHVHNDLDSMVRAVQMRGKLLKLILENGMLSREEVARVCEMVVGMGIPYVKTGTGYHGHSATVDMVTHLRSLLPDKIRIKAAGGIRDKATALALLEAGADRIGSSASVAIVKEQ